MSCCPEAPPIRVGSDAPPIDGPEQDLRPGETVECFSLRAGNSTGAHDDATLDRKNTILNESIPTDCQAKVSVKFKLTANSDAASVIWAISGDPTPGVSLVGDTLSGTFDPSVHKKKITVTVTATFPSGTTGTNGEPKLSDERTYSFSPSICAGNDSISFVSPFPGGELALPRGKFGMRFHPIHKVDKMHNGIDMVHPTVKGVNHPIVAAADGVVIKARNTDPRGYGNAIHIKHVNGKGEHLCTTTYNHLHKMLVSEGDKVSAGQQIALEGGAKGDPNAGGSTGLHLHFECKLPNGSFTDPLPYIGSTVPVGDAPGSTTTPSTPSPPTGATVNSADVAAKTGCPETGTSAYPADPNKPEPAAEAAPAGTSSDPFEAIWAFTMRYEVGPHWAVPAGSAPTDPEIVAGLCDTSSQKKKCGWVIDHGGETKFGIAKNGNPRTDIKTMTYAEAKNLGYSNYWKRGRVNPSAIPAYLGMFMFDTNYNHGDGNGRTIYNDAGLSSGPWPDKASQMADLEKLYQRRLAFANSLKVVAYRKGVAARVTACYEYVKSQTL